MLVDELLDSCITGFIHGHAWMALSIGQAGQVEQKIGLSRARKTPNGRTDWQTDRQTDRQTEAYKWRDRHMDGWIDEKAKKQQGMQKRKK